MSLIRSDSISYSKPPLDLFLKEYNGALASVLLRHCGSFKYAASITLGRLESQTHLYETVEKYLQMDKLLGSDGEIMIELSENESDLYVLLSKKYPGRVKGSSGRSGRGNIIIVERLLFLCRLSRELVKAFVIGRLAGSIKSRPQTIIRSWFDKRCQRDGRFRDEYFDQLVGDIGKVSKTLVVYKLINGSVKETKLFNKFSKSAGFHVCLVESFLSLTSILKIFCSYIFSRIILKERVLYRNTDIAPVIQRALNKDYFELRNLVAYIEKEAADKMLGLEPQRIIFPYENQTWEKVYPILKRKMRKDLQICGFQHTGFSYKLLNYFPSKEDASLPYFPDRIITVGAITKRVLEEMSLTPCPVLEGPALRHQCLPHNRREFILETKTSEIKGRIVYAFSYDISKYKGILNILIKTFGGSKVQVYLKVHPLYKEEDIVNKSGLVIPDNFILAQKIPWKEIYENVDLVLYDDNSVGIEAISHGIKTFLLDEGEPIYECGRMFYFDGWKSRVNSIELEQIKSELENGSFDKSFDIEAITKYVNLYYNVYRMDDHLSLFMQGEK